MTSIVPIAINNWQKMRYLARTKISVDINNLGTNTKCIAVREKPMHKEIRPGVWVDIDCQHFSVENFTNIYDIYWDPKQTDIVPLVRSSNKLYHLSTHTKNDPSIIATINGGFFFYAHMPEQTPAQLPYNLCIRDGKIFGLPCWDHPVVYIRDGQLEAHEIIAAGAMTVGSTTLKWVGGKSEHVTDKKYDCVLYNSKYTHLAKVRDENNIQLSLLDPKTVYTPKKADVTDIIFDLDENGGLYVKNIQKGGGSNFYDSVFILQTKRATSIKIGDRTRNIAINGLPPLNQISSAITIGRSIHSPYFSDKIRVHRRDCRSILAKDVKGRIHIMVFDGSKYSPGFHGVTAQEIHHYFAKDKFEWAYFLDGGGSSRSIVRDKNKLTYFANQFAFKWLPDGSKLWDWQNAREICSSIELRVKSA